MLLIDGNRNGSQVLFDHEMHIARQGGRDEACVKCHHMRKPQEAVSECSACHRDMYLPVDMFDHDTHVEQMEGNAGCGKCHTDPAALKQRANTKPCAECHREMRPIGTRVEISTDQQTTMAVGYMDAMHGLCISCHEEVQEKLERRNENFARCATCHQNSAGDHNELGRVQ